MKPNLKALAVAAVNFTTYLAMVLSTAGSREALASPEPTLLRVSRAAAAKANRASLVAIEKSFLQIPAACKARSAAFDPKPVGEESLSPRILALHGQLDDARGPA